MSGPYYSAGWDVYRDSDLILKVRDDMQPGEIVDLLSAAYSAGQAAERKRIADEQRAKAAEHHLCDADPTCPGCELKRMRRELADELEGAKP